MNLSISYPTLPGFIFLSYFFLIKKKIDIHGNHIVQRCLISLPLKFDVRCPTADLYAFKVSANTALYSASPRPRPLSGASTLSHRTHARWSPPSPHPLSILSGTHRGPSLIPPWGPPRVYLSLASRRCYLPLRCRTASSFCSHLEAVLYGDDRVQV